MKGNRKIALLGLLFSSLILASCGSQGLPGEQGPIGPQGPAGQDGNNGADGKPGQDGDDGLSAYEIYIKHHPEYTKSEKEWIEDVVSGKLSVSDSAKVTFMLKGEVYQYQIVRKGYNIDEPKTPELAKNEKFLGWYFEDKEWFFEGYSISEDIVLEAKIEIIETVEPEPVLPSDPTDLKTYDPFYPEGFDDTPYKLVVPDFEERLILNESKTVATLFAPHVSKESGFFDANKNFVNDMYLCWAATGSNLIAWYLNELSLLKVDLTGIDT